MTLRRWLVAAVLLLGACAAAPPRPVVGHTAAWTAACGDIYLQELHRPIDPSGLAECLRRIRAGAQDADLRGWIRGSQEYADLQARLHPSVPPAPVLHADGRIFRTDGRAWRWKGVSAFALLDRFAHGQDISDTLDAYRGYNVLRVWPYVPRADWGAKAWDAPDVATIKAFLAHTASLGWTVELTLLTDDDPARLAWAKRLIPLLAGTPGLVLEAGNEPTTHKHIDTAALIPALQASGLPWTTGNYEQPALMAGTYGVTHTGRDAEWPRRAHDLLEFFQGGGPNAPTDPPHRFPVVADEPAKLEDLRKYGGMTAADVRAYFAACALLGAGATWHSESGKYGLPPTSAEATLAKVALQALDAFPADAPLGAYRRPVEASLRTYVVGRYMVRIRPTSPRAPEAGWTALDADGITWRK